MNLEITNTNLDKKLNYYLPKSFFLIKTARPAPKNVIKTEIYTPGIYICKSPAKAKFKMQCFYALDLITMEFM